MCAVPGNFIEDAQGWKQSREQVAAGSGAHDREREEQARWQGTPDAPTISKDEKMEKQTREQVTAGALSSARTRRGRSRPEGMWRPTPPPSSRTGR